MYTIRNNKKKDCRIVKFKKKAYSRLFEVHPWAACSWIPVLLGEIEQKTRKNHIVDYDQSVELHKLLNKWPSYETTLDFTAVRWFILGTRLLDVKLEDSLEVYNHFAKMIFKEK